MHANVYMYVYGDMNRSMYVNVRPHSVSAYAHRSDCLCMCLTTFTYAMMCMCMYIHMLSLFSIAMSIVNSS